ncbi:DNA methyltransferase [Algibacter mikhailovii]|uniref:DNA methyltransferase n=1 Tax=Algibacter mikhailovii TaxID=425498 RepID=UPI002493D898|nr:DNA methyltransferase [Algibacter mikhailovii]
MEVIQKITRKERDNLFEKYEHFFATDNNINRKTVSFQANKTNPFYRWFKYKEGFSANLVEYYLEKYEYQGKNILDPFSGTGTTLFAGSELNCIAYGIELLPVGIFATEARQASERIDFDEFKSIVSKLWQKVDSIKKPKKAIEHIRITNGAFPEKTENDLNKYLTFIDSLQSDLKIVLKFAAFSILEQISYTRKDGQYLRWDYRSNRTAAKSKFNKGHIYSFREAIDEKINQIIDDLDTNHVSDLFQNTKTLNSGSINLFQDSCLTKLTDFENEKFDCVITSPPYCNRYDYTRTYALELVFLGCDNEKVKELRQTMLSCTVENKSKIDELEQFYKSIKRHKTFLEVQKVFNSSLAMNEVNDFLEYYKSIKKLNNNGIARMVKNYFLEMAFTIFELSRSLKKGGRIIMVNDNVQYVGEEIPVDLILSDFAVQFGLSVENIIVLDQKKGNSSQQMGNHGRNPIRKCVYIWQKK